MEDGVFRYAAASLILALIAAFFGFSDVAQDVVEIARVLFYIFLIVGIVSLVIGLAGRRM